MIARNEFDSNPMLIDVIRKSTNEKEIIYPKFTEDISDTWFNGFDPTLKDITLILQVMGKE